MGRKSSRVAGITAALTAAVLGLAACTADPNSAGGAPAQSNSVNVVVASGNGGVQTLNSQDAAQVSIAASHLVYKSSDIAVLGTPDDAGQLAAQVKKLKVPGLLVAMSASGAASGSGAASDPPAPSAAPSIPASGAATPAASPSTQSTSGTSAPAGLDADAEHAVGQELDRLGVKTIVVPKGFPAGNLAKNRKTVQFDPQSLDITDGKLPDISRSGGDAKADLFTEIADKPGPAEQLAQATVESAGGKTAVMAGGDPRSNTDTVNAAKAANGANVLAIGPDFGPPEQLKARLAFASSTPQLPGGGQVVFPNRRMVAVYGAVGTPSLGILGEQDLDATVKRVKDLAASYQPYSQEPVIPAMEIIATVASGDAGADGNYSNEVAPETIAPWIKRAQKEGIYVVLDLQSGMSDFTSQAKLYADLLKHPNVGLALDPEWRLKPGQRPLQQIGSVDVSEVNDAAAWLAQLTADNHLPQKVFIMHQFSLNMIHDRQNLDTSHEQLAMLIHADGNGTPELKLGTWNALQQGLPAGVRMAWKNFYDEDQPTFTPKETMDVQPKPWFVSYQ